MLGIYKVVNSTPFERWIGAWLQILDHLFSALTLEFFYCDFEGWWTCGDFAIDKSSPMKFKLRVRWWVDEWTGILGEFVSILSLGQLHADW